MQKLLNLNVNITATPLIHTLRQKVRYQMEQRLIDANKLDITTIQTDDYSGNEILDIVLKEDIDDALTVLTIPESPTNGDMQKAILPNHWEYGTNEEYVHVWGDGQTMTFTLDWWNAPWKEESNADSN